MNSFNDFLFVMIAIKNKFVIQIFNILSDEVSNMTHKA
jgi:hypothetical protein